MSKKAPGRGLPRPPKIKAHLAQRLERRRQGGRDIIGLKRGHSLRAGSHRFRAGFNRDWFQRQVYAEFLSSRANDRQGNVVLHNMGQFRRFCSLLQERLAQWSRADLRPAR